MEFHLVRAPGGFAAGHKGPLRRETPYWLHASHPHGGVSMLLMGEFMSPVLAALSALRTAEPDETGARNADRGKMRARIDAKGLMYVFADQPGQFLDHATGDLRPLHEGLVVDEAVCRTLSFQATAIIRGVWNGRPLTAGRFDWVFSQSNPKKWADPQVARLATDIQWSTDALRFSATVCDAFR